MKIGNKIFELRKKNNLIYLLILFLSVFIALHFITKKDFTSKYQTEFTCTINNEKHYINVDLEDVNII